MALWICICWVNNGPFSLPNKDSHITTALEKENEDLKVPGSFIRFQNSL